MSSSYLWHPLSDPAFEPVLWPTRPHSPAPHHANQSPISCWPWRRPSVSLSRFPLAWPVIYPASTDVATIARFPIRKRQIARVWYGSSKRHKAIPPYVLHCNVQYIVVKIINTICTVVVVKITVIYSCRRRHNHYNDKRRCIHILVCHDNYHSHSHDHYCRRQSIIIIS